MIRSKQAIVVGIAVLAATVTAFAQDSPQARGRGNPVQAAIEAFGLAEEQVDQIPGDPSRETAPRSEPGGAPGWLQERTSKIQAGADRRAEGQGRGSRSSCCEDAGVGGSQVPGLDRRGASQPGGTRRASAGPEGWKGLSGCRRSRRGTAFRRGGRGWQGPGYRGRRWGPPGGPGGPAWERRGGPDRGDRRGRRGNRD